VQKAHSKSDIHAFSNKEEAICAFISTAERTDVIAALIEKYSESKRQ